MANILKINNVRSGYNSSDVLCGITIEISEGEIVALLGWNGAGKSTCLKTIAGIIKPRSGEIWLDKSRIDGASSKAIRLKGVGFAMQNHRCFQTMTVLENIQIAGQLLSKKVFQIRMNNILDEFPEISNFMSRKAGELSGGEQQVLALGMALIIPSRILLLDEPSHGLDPLAKGKLRDICIKLSARGTSILLVEQDKEFALEMASKKYWLEEGKCDLY